MYKSLLWFYCVGCNRHFWGFIFTKKNGTVYYVVKRMSHCLVIKKCKKLNEIINEFWIEFQNTYRLFTFFFTLDTRTIWFRGWCRSWFWRCISCGDFHWFWFLLFALVFFSCFRNGCRDFFLTFRVCFWFFCAFFCTVYEWSKQQLWINLKLIWTIQIYGRISHW